MKRFDDELGIAPILGLVLAVILGSVGIAAFRADKPDPPNLEAGKARWEHLTARIDKLEARIDSIETRLPSFEVFFTPPGCAKGYAAASRCAQHRLWLQEYELTLPTIGDALKAAHTRGVDVEVILDKSQEHTKNSIGPDLLKAGIKVFTDDKHAIAHNKIVLVDDEMFSTASYNPTRNGETHNAENMLLVYNAPEQFSLYLENYRIHRDHSREFVSKVSQ